MRKLSKNGCTNIISLLKYRNDIQTIKREKKNIVTKVVIK